MLGPVLGVVNNAGIGSAKRMFRDIPVEDRPRCWTCT